MKDYQQNPKGFKNLLSDIADQNLDDRWQFSKIASKALDARRIFGVHNPRAYIDELAREALEEGNDQKANLLNWYRDDKEVRDLAKPHREVRIGGTRTGKTDPKNLDYWRRYKDLEDKYRDDEE